MASFTIDYFEVPSADSGRSTPFYKAAFGWTLQNFGDTYHEIRGAGALGGINGDAEDRSAAPLVGIRTDDIGAAEAAVREAGGTITRPAYAYPGGTRFFFREPGGAELMVYQPSD